MDEKPTLQLMIEVTQLEKNIILQAAQKLHLEAEDYIKNVTLKQAKEDAQMLLPAEKLIAIQFKCCLKGNVPDNAIAVLKLHNNATQYPTVLWKYWLEENYLYVLTAPQYAKDVKKFLNALHRGYYEDNKTTGQVCNVIEESEREVTCCANQYFI